MLTFIVNSNSSWLMNFITAENNAMNTDMGNKTIMYNTHVRTHILSSSAKITRKLEICHDQSCAISMVCDCVRGSHALRLCLCTCAAACCSD